MTRHVIIGMITLSIGIGMCTLGAIFHKRMWEGVITETVRTVVHDAPSPAGDPNEVTVGPLKVEYRWYTDDKKSDCKNFPMNCNATGEYQLRDAENKIWVVQFCDPIPEIRDFSTIQLTYLKNDEKCTRFVNAKILAEPPLPPKDDKPKPKDGK